MNTVQIGSKPTMVSTGIRTQTGLGLSGKTNPNSLDQGLKFTHIATKLCINIHFVSIFNTLDIPDITI